MPATDVEIILTGCDFKVTPEMLGLTSQWSTLYLPENSYTFDISGIEGLKAYTVTEVDREAGEVRLTEERYLMPGIPMVICGNDVKTVRETNLTPVDEGTEGTAQPSLTGVPHGAFVGVGAKAGATVDESKGRYYVLNTGQFIPVTTGSVAQGRCYLLLKDAVSHARLRLTISGGDGDATPIDAVESDLRQDDAGERWFNMNGMRIDRPSAKGIYILNGRKVVVR